MKIKNLLAACLPLVPLPANAAVNISGTMLYQQNFNSLPAAGALSQFDWVDDLTIPGFYLHRSNPPAGETNLAGTRTVDGQRPYTSGGTVAANGTPNFHGFLNLGTYNNTDRALGASPTTTDGEANWSGGTLSILGVFTNATSNPVSLSRVSFAVENWFANSVTTTPESVLFTYKVGNAPALLAELGTYSANANFSVAGYTPVDGGVFDVSSTTGFSTPAVPGRTLRSADLTTAIRVPAGQTLVLCWRNANDGGTDAQVGIDDLELQFNELTATVEPVISAVSRDDNGTPQNPTDDLVSFDVTTTGTGTVSASGWTVTAPAAFAGGNAGYGLTQRFTAPVSQFTGAGHTLQITVADQGDNGVNQSVSVAAPWCSLSAITVQTRSEGPTLALTDDTWGYTVTVNALFGGASFTSNNAAIPSGNYGTAYTVTDIPIATASQTTVFTDALDPACTLSLTVGAPRVIGTKNLGATVPLYSEGGIPANWVVNETAATQVMNNGGDVPAKVYRSEVMDLSAVGFVRFSGTLTVGDSSSGFEADDSFTAYLLIDGNTAAPVSLIAASDVNTPLDGVLNGAELSPATPGPPPVSGSGTFTHRFLAEIPDTANSVQLVIAGNNDSTSETMTVGSLLFEQITHSIAATLGTPVFDNKGTIDPLDDEFYQPVQIRGWALPPDSTGWISNATPGSGAYADSNPIVFGPFTATDATRAVVITDSFYPGVGLTLNIPTPATGIGSAIGALTRNPGADLADTTDDTLTFDLAVQSRFGGPEFRISVHPGTVAASSLSLSAVTQTTTVTLTGIPDHGESYVELQDASYPGRKTLWLVPVPAVTASTFVVAKTRFGSVVNDVPILAGSTFPAAWSNHPASAAVQLRNGTAGTVSSGVIDLSPAHGAVKFTANLHALDLSSGFEAIDTFKAELILNGDAAHPVNLISAYDTNGDGAMNGAELVGLHEGLNYDTRDFPLNYDLPAGTATVQLVITAANDSTNEILILEDAQFAASGDSDGDGISDESEEIMGTDPQIAASVTRLRQSGASSSDFLFDGVDGRYYRIYISDDNSAGTHLRRWVDSGISFAGGGTHTVGLQFAPEHPRRFLRLHVMKDEGPWPAEWTE